MEKQKTYRDLKIAIEALTDEQLDMPVYWCGEGRGGTVYDFDVLTEDHVDPSGDGMEPISAYASDPDFQEIEASEPIVAYKGQLLLFVDV